MPRTARATEAGMVYHVLNRGNGRMRLFHKPGDYQAFEQVLMEGIERYPVELPTYCIMPNHWHLVVRPKTDKALGRWMGWVQWVNAAMANELLDGLRECAERGRPLGPAV